jgi:hypothetical protein
MGHSDALLDHVPGIRLELYLELPTLCRVAFIGRLDPCEELCVIGDKLLERRELDPRLRCCGFVGGQDGLVQPCVALRRCGEELKRAFEGLWGKRRGVRDDVDQAIQRRSTCAASAPANRVGRTRYTRTRVTRYVRIEVEWMRLVDDDGPRCGCPARGGLSLGCAVVFHLHVFNGRVYIHARHLCYWSACSAAVRSTRGSERGSQVSISRDSRPANRLSYGHGTPQIEKEIDSCVHRGCTGAAQPVEQEREKGVEEERRHRRSRGETRVSSRGRAHARVRILFSTSPLLVSSYHSSTLQKKTDSELFVVDTKGDDKGTALCTFLNAPSYIRSPSQSESLSRASPAPP